ncbi:MAG: hypothetical protein RI538_09400 [Salibaculum sp.]|uniref:hypothetical protein n=1 Tax=Salibaculum sp. TaxID=2855480 RepID=UPI0028702B74|nr:hypothetical protein [Salibaculum sp.]MDR9428585.1 hypothetical protein [Salibaculum sp.]MDR9482977.1 hypothetical protein [Salibaculum sp.]
MGGTGMQIVFHIGANRTDEDRLLKSLLRNGDAFAAKGIKVPGPSKYRRLLRETIQGLDGGPPAPDTRDILLDAIVDAEDCNRLVMSNEQFMCVHRRIFNRGQIYRLGDEKFTGIDAIFPDDEIEIFLGLRNPATWLPAVFNAIPDNDFNDFMGSLAPADMRWSEVATKIRTLIPRARLTVWCNEDTPLIWAPLIREIAGVDPRMRIEGSFDLLQSIMSAAGMKRFVTELESNPPQTEAQTQRIISAFLEEYALPEAIEEEIDLPGWTTDTVQFLTERYEADCREIAQMSGVTFLAP